MAANDNSKLYQQLAALNARPQNAVMPSRSNALDFRDATIRAMQSAPGLSERLKLISQGAPPKPSGALGTLGSLAVNNPLTKGILGGLTAIDIPRRAVISGIKEFKDAVDNNPNTKASFTDYRSQVADPTFGFGRVMPMGGWGGRVVGLFGDLIFDPINWATLGGAILKKSVVKTGEFAASTAVRELAELSSEELIAGGFNQLANKVIATSATEAGKTTNLRKFLGVKKIQGRAGNEALASGAAKLGATNSEVAEILARGRNAVPDEIVKLMGLNDYGIYYFGSRIKVPFSGVMGKGLAAGLTKGRLGILATRPGEYLARMATPNGVAGGMSLRDIRFAGRAGKEFPSGLTPKMGLAILDGEKAMRAAKGIAARDAAKLIGDTLSHPDVKAEADVIYKFLDTDVIPSNITDRQKRAIDIIQNATNQLYRNIESNGIAVDVNFKIAKWRERYFPHKLTAAAQKYLEGTASKRVEDIRQYLKVDHSNIGGSFESRNLEALVKSGKKDVDWFGTILTEQHIAGGIDTLNELARNGGFKGDFFETNINRALTSYLENYTEGLGTIAFYRSLKEAGSDIGGMAVSRGMITREALDGIVSAPEQAHRLLVSTMTAAKENAKKYIDAVIKEAQTDLKTQQKVANVTTDELVNILDTGVRETKIQAGRTADAAVQKTTLDNLAKARETFALQKANVIKNYLALANQFEKASFIAEELGARHTNLADALDQMDARLRLYADSIVDYGTNYEAKMQMAKDLEILNNTIDINIREVQSTIDNLGQHTHEFVNDAIGRIVDYTLGTGKDYSTIVRNLNDISSYGRIIGGVNAAGGKRGIAEGLGATNIRALLNAQKKAVPIGSALDVAQWDAWVEVKDLLNLSEAKRTTLEKLTRDDVLEILTRAGSSTDANDVGAVRESIAWIFVRSQLDNPNFAKDLLDNPTKSFETVKRILKSAEIQERYAATFALEVFDPKTEMMVIKNIKDLPPELQKAGRVIELYDAIDNLEKQAAQVNEHLTRVPDTRTNVIAASMDDAFGDVFTSLPPDTPINTKAWPVIIDHLKTIYSEVDHGTPELEQYITRLEAFTKLPNQEMTYDELMGDIRSRFSLGVPTSERGGARFSMQDLRLSAQERALYPSGDEFESFRPRILRKQKSVLTELETARTELKTVTNKLTTTQKEELAIVLGNAAKDSVEGSISEQSMALARATTDLYLEQESMYVLHAANKELSQVGQSLTPQGHAQLMNLTHQRFAATNEAHLVRLNTAKELLHQVARNVMNSGKSGVDFKLQLQQELRDLLKNPESRDVIEELFPGIALAIRTQYFAPEALVLSTAKNYQGELNILADTELRYFGVSGSQPPGGASTIDYASSSFVPDETTVRDLESGRRLQESTMGSQGLQKQSILEKLHNKKHTSTTTYIENLKKKLNLSKVLTEEQKKNARYELDLVQGRLNEVHAEVMADIKSAKELSTRSGGSSRIRTIQQRARGNARGNFDVNSIERIVAKALDSKNTSARPVKEFFAALFGGDDFKVPTIRGSEARRLEGLSFSVVRPEDSYFGRNIQIATEARDTASKRLYSTNPTEAEAMLHKADYIKFLQDELSKLEQAIKDRPEAFKLLQQANKDLDRAEKAAGGVYNEQTRQWEGGLSYTDRINYLDNLAVIAGETFPSQRILNAETGKWERKAIPGTTRKNASGLLPEIGAPYSQPAQYGPALASKQMSLVQGLPIPERSFTPQELELLKKHKLATILHDRFISQDEYGFALRAQQEYKFKDQLAEVDLTKVDWTVNGDTTNAMSWDRKLEQTVSKSIAADGELEPFTNSDTIFETTATPFAKNINTLKSPFDKDIGTLIGRMNDTNRPNLIFINQQDGREIYLRVAREQDGTPLGYLEKAIHDPNGGPLSSVGTATQNAPAPPNTEWVAIPKINPSTGEIYPNEFTYTLQTKVGPAAPSDAPWQEQVLSRNSIRWEPWDYRSEQIKIIEPREVAQENTNVMRKKELQLNDAGGNGTVFNPEEVWVRHNPAKLSSGDSLVASNIVNPPYYTKMSQYIGAEMPPEPILDHFGNPMRFSAVEQEALHENFTNPIYNIVRNPNKQVYSREVMRLQDIITTKSAAIVDIQKTIDGSLRGRIGNSSAEQVRQTQKRILSTFKEDIKDAEDSLQKLLHAAEVWDSRTSANQKVASLYNSFEKGTFGKQTGINSGTQKPHNAIKNWLQTQVSSNRSTPVSVSDAVKKARQTIGKELWDKSGHSKIINEADSLAKDVEIRITAWADQDAQVVTNLIRAKEKIRNVGELNGLTADMKKAALQNELVQQNVPISNKPFAPTMENLRPSPVADLNVGWKLHFDPINTNKKTATQIESFLDEIGVSWKGGLSGGPAGGGVQSGELGMGKSYTLYTQSLEQRDSVLQALENNSDTYNLLAPAQQTEGNVPFTDKITGRFTTGYTQMNDVTGEIDWQKRTFGPNEGRASNKAQGAGRVNQFIKDSWNVTDLRPTEQRSWLSQLTRYLPSQMAEDIDALRLQHPQIHALMVGKEGYVSPYPTKLANSYAAAVTPTTTGTTAPATMAQLRTGVADVSSRVTADLERGPFVQPAAVSREEMLLQSRQQLQDIELGPEAQQASQMQADLGWAEFVNQDVLQAGKNLSKERAALAKDLEKSGKGLDTAQAQVVKLAKDLGPDPYISSPLARRARDLGIISNPMTAQETVLQNAQKAYDISSFLHTGDDIASALEKIDSIQKVIALGTKAKGSLKSLKNVADYPAFATEFNIFHEEATKYLKLVSNPQVDEKIREQAIKWVESNTAYFKQVANMSEAERLAKTVAGLKAANYADPKTGEIKEGKLVGDNALLYRQVEGAWLQHFDDGMVRLGKQFPNIQVAEPIAEFVQNVHRLQEPAVAMELNRFLGEYTKFFKAYATLSPGFHVRNSISNGFMLFAAGGNPKYLLEGFQMSRSLNEASKSGKSVEEWILSLPYDRRAEARIGVRASAASGGGNASDNLRQLYMSGRLVNNPLTRTSKSLGQWIEGHSRFMLAYDGARQGMDFNTSAARVQRFLIDYEDVSTLDKSLRQIIPFWMWTSRNLPMQVQNIWLNPRAYNIYGNIKRNFTDQSQEQDVVPIWMKEMGAWKLPFGNNLYASPDMGFNRIQSDVNMLQDPARFLSNVNPLIRLPIELTGERQLFSNKRFSKTPVEVSGGAGAALQPLMEILGYGQTGPTGKKFVDDKAFYALRNILPMLSRSESLNPSIGTNPDSPNPLYGLLGLPMRENNQQMQNNELMRRMFEMQSAVQNNKALGGQP